jgi:basic membrane protein A
MRRLGLAAVALLLVAGCGPKSEGGAGKTADSGKNFTAAMVTDTGGIDDQSFNAASWEGLKRAQDKLGIPKPKYLESKEQADYKTNLSSLADQKNDLIFAVGFMMEDALKDVAPKYPTTKFAIIDGSSPTGPDGKPLPNTVSLKFREEEGSFLAGYLAARMSKTGTIGFVGGMESPLIKKFEVGYYAGARTGNPKIVVIPKYVGSWTDNGKGQQIANTMFDQHADILFAAAGKSGLGVLDAANERGAGYYAIGVDSDQDHIHPGRVLTSMMKGVDAAVFDTVKQAKEGKWTSGEHVFGIKEGGIHLSPMTYTKKDVPADVLMKLDTISKMIADGKIKVPSTEEERQNFQPSVIP